MQYPLALLVIAILAVLGGVAVFTSPSEQGNVSAPGGDASDATGESVMLIPPTEADSIIADPQTFVLDVHTPEQPHIPGTDAFIPYDQLKQHRDDLPQDTSTPIFVYCRSGSMSRQASEELVQMGYATVYDLEGGIQAYRESHVAVTVVPEQTDLGTVTYGDVARTVLTLTNFTPAPLAITRVSTSCGCTKAEVVNAELAPYESTDVNVSFDPAVHKDETDLGDVTREIYISTDNPQFSRVTATITASVVGKDEE